MTVRSLLIGIVVFVALAGGMVLHSQAANPYSQWVNGPSTAEDFFPIGVWLQEPEDAEAYKNAGINTYVGLWVDQDLNQMDTYFRYLDAINAMKANNMQIILGHAVEMEGFLDDKLPNGNAVVAGFLHEDEPDNYPQTPAADIQDYYHWLKDFDASRPVLLNMSQGMGWDEKTWVGQGGAINPDLDYPQYLAGADIGAMDIYPMNCSRPDTCGDAWRPALGVDRLQEYGPEGQLVWNYIETGDINVNGSKATVDEIKMEVWSSIIHGSQGIAYFIHENPGQAGGDPNALLAPENAAHLAGITAINQEIHSLAAVINSETQNELAVIQSLNPSVPIDSMVKVYDGATYVFASSMRDVMAAASFNFPELGDATVEVIGEDREILMFGGQFADLFGGFGVHLYKINAATVVVLLPGDTNDDGAVNLLDLTVVGENYNTSCDTGHACGDFDGNGFVDLIDLTILGENYGTTPTPEPAAMSLLLAGGLVVFRRRK